MRILVIEDDKEVANYLTRGLREFGMVVDAIGDAAPGWSWRANERMTR